MDTSFKPLTDSLKECKKLHGDSGFYEKLSQRLLTKDRDLSGVQLTTAKDQKKCHYIQCTICTYTTSNQQHLMRHYVQHQPEHAIQSYLAFCPVRGCKYVADTYNMIRAHLTTDHEEQIRIKTILHGDGNIAKLEELSQICRSRPPSVEDPNKEKFYCTKDGCSYFSYRKNALKKHARKCVRQKKKTDADKTLPQPSALESEESCVNKTGE